MRFHMSAYRTDPPPRSSESSYNKRADFAFLLQLALPAICGPWQATLPPGIAAHTNNFIINRELHIYTHIGSCKKPGPKFNKALSACKYAFTLWKQILVCIRHLVIGAAEHCMHVSGGGKQTGRTADPITRPTLVDKARAI